MKQLSTVAVTMISTLLGGGLLAGNAVAQQKTIKQQLVGTWNLVSFEPTDATGAKVPAFEGPDLKGFLIFTDGGHLSFQVMTELPKIAAKERLKSTPEEDEAIARGILSYWGTYTVNETDKSFTIRIERSSFANQQGMEAKRVITSLTTDELKYENPARIAGGQVRLVWKRAQQ
jgi:Lipocalin-like domain